MVDWQIRKLVARYGKRGYANANLPAYFSSDDNGVRGNTRVNLVPDLPSS